MLLLQYGAAVHAQPYYFRHYQVENGLSNNSVFSGTQDKNGFMWFGTKDGLNRFDGYQFKVFNVNSSDEGSLTRDHISSLVTDKKGRLWVGSQKGLFRFNAEREQLIPFIDTLKDINDLFLDNRGQLWFTSELTVCRYNFEKKQLSTFPPGRYFTVTSFCQMQDGAMWFATSDGYLKQSDNNMQTFKTYDVFAHSPASASKWISKIIPGEKGTIYIGTPSQGVKQFNPTTSDYKDVLIQNPDKTSIYVRDILQANDTEFWFATESGIFILNIETRKFTNVRKKYLDPYSLSDNAIYTLYKDSEGGVWTGSYFGGINYFPKQYSSFQKYFPDYTNNSISGSAVREICPDDFGNIWIGTEDAGLNKLNTRTGKLTRFEPTGLPGSIAYSNIHGLLAVKNNLWIGTFEHGLDVMDIRTGKVTKHYTAGTGEHDLTTNFIVSLLQTRNGDVYLGCNNSLLKYLPESDAFLAMKDKVPGVFISSMMEDQAGIIWVGTHDHGVFYFNPATDEKGHFENEPDNKNSLTTNTINALYEDSFHNLWFATEGGGLCRLNKSKKHFTRYTTKNGLPSNFVYKVLEDNRNALWVTTSKGLVNLDLLQNRTTVYTKSNGLLNDQFNYNSGYKDEGGKLYFGSVRGMITFKPEEFYQSSFIPPVQITGFQVHNEELEIGKETSTLKQSIVHTDEITLSHTQSSFSIDFAAISFTSPEVTQYSYMMKGLDENWTHLKSNRKVYFTNLKPGSYTFKLKATNNSISNRQEKSLTIQILPPFWATPWAFLFYIIVGGSLLYYLVRLYHQMLMNKKEKDIYEAKIEFFTNIAHEIRTPLTLIKGPVENLSELVHELPVIKEDVSTMERNTNRLITLVNQILDFRQTETKQFSLDFKNVNISEVLREAYLTYEPVLKKKNLQCIMDLPAANLYTMADEEALNKIFSNLFNNAVKYAERKVTIKLVPPDRNSNHLIVEIGNDGYMIPYEMREKIFEPFFRLQETAKQKGAGIGLALARSLVELHKGYLVIKDCKENLNVFIVRLPYYYDTSEKKVNTSEKTSALQINKN
ncbi:MAG: two-component regulator propeller domain-containing protein [Chitinophagaceae bacterium]